VLHESAKTKKWISSQAGNDKKRQEEWHFTLSFPNVSIGNPEENGSPIRSGMTKGNGFRIKCGMTKRDKRNDKKNGSPFSWG